MKRYLFNSKTILKEKDRYKWWLDDDIIKQIEITAEDVHQALELFIKEQNENGYVSFSKSAIKNKGNIYIDTDNKPIQVGYVLIGKTAFQEDKKGGYIDKYIEVCIEIQEISTPSFL
jgi:hypothetical protein